MSTSEGKDDDVKKAKMKRRNGKAVLACLGKVVTVQIAGNRSIEEVRKALELYEQAFSDLVVKHEDLTILIEDDEQFAAEERWLEECQETFLWLKIDTEDYMKQQTISKEKQENNETLIQQADNLTSQENKTKSSLEGNVQAIQPDNVSSTASGTAIGATTANVDKGPSAFQMEKPKMPKFSGDVRELVILKAEFKHLVEARYSKRDAITILRASLQGKALEMIKGIGQDYDAVWEYLESVYGDQRFVADITQDISRFKPIKDGEDARFCDLVHLVRRSFNTLKEVGRENGMNNNHMLAIIEQKMFSDDRKVWSRHLESTKSQATLETLISWMTSEMKSRMRSTAPLRSSWQSPKTVDHITQKEEIKEMNHKCWICKTSAHWTDQCQKFTTMNASEHFKVVKENHACFSCLKRAGRSHNVSTCSCRRQCSETVYGAQCKYYHHPLLHVANPSLISTVTTNGETILPIVLAEILGPQKVKKQGNVLLDTGAQVSLIRTSVAEELGLKGKNVTMTIAKVGGEEEMTTKMYRFRIRCLEKQAIHTVLAVGIPFISSIVSEIKVNDVAKIFGFGKK